MSKQKIQLKNSAENNQQHKSEIGRGQIKHNFLAALVTSKLYKMQVVKSKKGKGSYQRKVKNSGQESYLILV
ncbi:MAG: ribosome alternative rescue factor ArfA [Saccharospirillaceae bacterium]|nr:ribosome alternative rescue factor ArfA [Pseudomonadales bacterium]NRB77482.1 ribosome alternative rescue factor ArfA [Saccharospirillaceae bacterium]